MILESILCLLVWWFISHLQTLRLYNLACPIQPLIQIRECYRYIYRWNSKLHDDETSPADIYPINDDAGIKMAYGG